MKKVSPEAVNRVLELVGTTSLLDSFASMNYSSICCVTGVVGNAWATKDFEVVGAIPSAVCSTTYLGDKNILRRRRYRKC